MKCGLRFLMSIRIFGTSHPQLMAAKDLSISLQAPQLFSRTDEYDFEDIEATKLRHGIKPQTKKRVVGHSWGEIAIGTAQSCAMMGVSTHLIPPLAKLYFVSPIALSFPS